MSSIHLTFAKYLRYCHEKTAIRKPNKDRSLQPETYHPAGERVIEPCAYRSYRDEYRK